MAHLALGLDLAVMCMDRGKLLRVVAAETGIGEDLALERPRAILDGVAGFAGRGRRMRLELPPSLWRACGGSHEEMDCLVSDRQHVPSRSGIQRSGENIRRRLQRCNGSQLSPL